MVDACSSAVAVRTALSFLLLVFLLKKLVHEHSLLIFLTLLFVSDLGLLLAPDEVFALFLPLLVTLDASHVLLFAHIDVLWIDRLVDL